MATVLVIGRKGCGKTRLISKLLSYPAHIEPPSVWPLLRIRNKYFNLGVKLVEVTENDGGISLKAIQEHRPTGVFWVVTPDDDTESATITDSVGFTSSLAFRCLVVNNSTDTPNAAGDDRWFAAAVANGLEYVGIPHMQSTPRATSLTSGLLQGELHGYDRLLQLLANTMWPTSERSLLSVSTKNRVVVAADTISDFVNLMGVADVKVKILEQLSATVCQVYLSNKYFSATVRVDLLPRDYVVAADAAFVATQHKDCPLLLYISKKADAAKMLSCLHPALPTALTQVVVVALPEASSDGSAAEEEASWCDERGIERVVVEEGDNGHKWCSEEGNVGIARLVEILSCAELPERRDIASMKTGNRILVVGNEQTVRKCFAGILGDEEGCISANGREIIPAVDPFDALEFYNVSLSNKYYNAEAKLFVYDPSSPDAIKGVNFSPEVAATFHAVCVVGSDATAADQWNSMEQFFARGVAGDEDEEVEGLWRHGDNSVKLGVFEAGNVDDDQFNAAVERCPIEFLAGLSREELTARLMEALQSTEWPEYTKASRESKPKASAASSSAPAPEASATAAADADDASEVPVYSCELPRHFFVDPFTLNAKPCAAITMKGDGRSAALAEAMQHVKKNGYLLPRAERERQAAIISECIADLVDDDEDEEAGSTGSGRSEASDSEAEAGAAGEYQEL